mgnify:CR=1 FL=1
MLPIIEFLKVFSGMLRSGKMSYSDALTRFRAQFGRPPDGLELSSIRKEVEKRPSNVFDLTGKQIDTSKPIIGGKNVAETEAQIKARMIKENRSNVQKSYLRQLDKKIMDEMDMTAKEMENMSSTALDDLRRNADPVGMKKQFDEITEGRGLGDFADDPDFFKDDYASGGLARVGMVGGGPVWKKFIEGLFMKASNDIRLGKGKWAGLNQDQWIKQHDDLTKMLKKWEMSGRKGLPEGASEFLGMNDLQVSKAIKDAEKQVLSKPKKTLEGIKKEGTIDISDPEVADEFTTFIKESDLKGYKDLEQKIEFPTLKKMPKSSQTDDLSQEIKKGVEDVMKDTSDEGLKRSIETDNLKLEFPGISDEMIDNILADTNPQRIAEVKQTMREALEMGKKGMSPDEIIKMFKDTTRTKQASGGIAGQLHLNEGGRASFTKGGKVSSGLANILGV